MITLNPTIIAYIVKTLLKGHLDERPHPLERPLDNVNLNKYIDFYP